MNYKTIIVAFLAVLTAGSALCAPVMPDDVVAIVRAGLDDSDSDVRIAAAQALSDLNDQESVPHIRKLLSDLSDTVRIRAAVCLAKMGDRSGVAEVRKMLAAKPQITDDMTPAQRMRAVARGTIRAKAARALGDMKDKESVPLLQGTYNGNEDGRVSDACLISLGKLGLATAKNEFLTGLKHTQAEVRSQAAAALGEIGDKTCFSPLRARLKDWSRDVRAAAALSLGKLKDIDSVSDITEMVNDEDEIVREKAVTALGLIGLADLVGVVNAKLNDSNGMVRMAAIEALFRLGVEPGNGFLLRVLEGIDRDARMRALAVLEMTAVVKDRKNLKPLLDEPDGMIRIGAAKTVILLDRRVK